MVIDCLSESAHFLALSHRYTIKIITDKFVDSVVKLHYMSKIIVSD